MMARLSGAARHTLSCHTTSHELAMADSSSLPAYSDVPSDEGRAERTPLLSPGYDEKPSQHVQVSVYNPGAGGQPEIRTYWWRWVVLTVFCLNLGAQNMVRITESPIADVIRCYYGVDDTAVNWLSNISLVTYMVLVAPFTWFLHRFGLRVTTVIASCANACGAALVVIGTGKSVCMFLYTQIQSCSCILNFSGANYFWFVLAGQGVASLCNVLLWGAPPLLSQVWFPASERATATAFSTAAPNVSFCYLNS